MDSELLPASSPQARPAPRERTPQSSIKWMVGEAIVDCQELLRLRQQTVTIDRIDGLYVDASRQDALARLVSLAIEEVSSVSCRRGALSLWATGRQIVIQSNHPLDIIGHELTVDVALRAATRQLNAAVDMTWEQGRGPRLTLTLPAAGGKGGRRQEP